MPHSNASKIERIQIALDILSGRNTEPSLPDLDALGYDAYSLRKTPSLEKIKQKCEEQILKLVTEN